MKTDGRKFDRQTLEEIRLMAVERVRSGEAASKVSAAYGFSRTTIYQWLAATTKAGVGIKALPSRKAPGRPRTLTTAQEKKKLRWIDALDRQFLELGRVFLLRYLEHLLPPISLSYRLRLEDEIPGEAQNLFGCKHGPTY